MADKPKYKNWKERRAAELGVDQLPQGSYIYFDKYPGYEDWYDVGKIRAAAKAAKKVGLPSSLGVALVMDETGVGNTDDLNMGRVNFGAHPEAQKRADQIREAHKQAFLQQMAAPAYRDAGDIVIGSSPGTIGDQLSLEEYKDAYYKTRPKMYREQMLDALDYSMEEMARQVGKKGLTVEGLQNYSGKGEKAYGGRPGRHFGRSNADTNFRITMDQGNRKMALMKAIKEHPEFKALLEEE